MKVLNVNIALDAEMGGGTAERTYQLSRFLVRHGVECTALILNLGRSLIDQLSRRQGVKVIMLPCLNRRFYVPWVSWNKLTTLVANADVVHLINHWTLLNALVYLALRKTNVPYVVCPAGALPIYGRSRWIKKLYQRWIGNAILKNASGYIAITNAEAEYFAQLGLDKKKIVLIPNGIENFSTYQTSDVLQRLGLQTVPYVLFVGRLNSIKGPDLLLEAFASLGAAFKKFHLVIAGPDDGMKKQLMAAVAANQLQDRVHFIGYISGLDKFHIYNNAALLVVPSRQEAMSIVVLEAGVLAKSVLITDQCGFPEVADVEGGMVVPATSAALAAGLEKMLAVPKNLIVMGKNLQAYVAQHFSWDIQVEKLIEFYRGIL